MSETELEDFLILRNFAEPIHEETFQAGAKAAMDVLGALNDEGVRIRWRKSHVRTEADEAVVGSMCQYQAEDEAAHREHRAGLPVTRIDDHGMTVENTE